MNKNILPNAPYVGAKFGKPCFPVWAIMATLAIGVSVLPALAVDGTWNVTTGTGSWAAPGSWVGSPNPVPGDAGSTVNLTAGTTATKDVILDGDRTVGILNLGSSGTYRVGLQAAPGTGGSLTFDNGLNKAQLNYAGTFSLIIYTPVFLNSSLDIDSGTSTNSKAFNGGVTAAGTGAKVMTLSGAGTGNVTIGSKIADGATATLSIRQNSATSGIVLSVASANSFTGGVRVSSGTLTAVNSDNKVFGTGTITLDGGNLKISQFSNFNFGNATVVSENASISVGRSSGTPAITHTLGTLNIGNKVLTVDNTGSGSTTLEDTLVFGATTLTGNATFAVQQVAAVNTRLRLGALSGAFNLTKTGNGILELSAAGSHSGTTTISAGLLELTNAQALQNSALDTTNSIVGTSTAGLKTIPTTLQLGGLIGNKDLASLFTTTAGGYTAVTALTLNPGTGVSNSYSGVIANGATGMTLTKTGAGTQILSGANSYTGATTVSVGTLLINNAYSVAGGGISVASLASVGGNATINRNISVADGGTLIAGDGTVASTLTVAANITLANNSKIHLVLGPAGAHSTLARSSGTWAFDGDQSFTLNPGAASGTYLGIITGLIGSEAGLASIATWSISNPGYAGSEFTYDSGNNWVNLNVVPEPSTAILMGLGLGLTLFGFRARVRRS